MSQVLFINGNPDSQSFSFKIQEAFEKGFGNCPDRLSVLDLNRLSFDPILHAGFRKAMPDEPDLIRAKAMIQKADRIVWCFPIWWGLAPASVLGFVDRVFTPSFALVPGKIGDLILTGGEPVSDWKDNANVAEDVFFNNIFDYVKIQPGQVLRLGNVVDWKMTDEKEAFLQRVERFAAELAEGK